MHGGGVERARWRRRQRRVARIRAHNEDVYRMVARARWVSDVSIGVCDGEAFGGQDPGR